MTRRLATMSFLFLFFVSCDAQQEDSTVVQTKIRESIDKRVSTGFSGTVLIALQDRVILNEGYGFTDSTRVYKITPTTLFNIASITKTFTALCILKLAEKHLLQLHDSIGKYFRTAPEDKRGITIHQLLTHTSGFGQHYAAMEVSNRDTAVEKYFSDTLEFARGAGFQYSNENYEMLAAIIEVTTGRDYETCIRDEILVPCRMDHTCFWGQLDDVDARKVAQKLRPLSKKQRERNWDYLGSGGIYSTSIDLFKLYAGVKSNKVLGGESTRLLFQPSTTLSSTGVGYGWFINETGWKTREYWTRGSEDFGHNAVLRWFPDDDVVIIVCSNTGELQGKTVTANRVISDDLVQIIFENKLRQ